MPSSAAKQATSASCLLNHVAKAISRRKSLNWRGHRLGLDAFQKRRANWSGVGGEGGAGEGVGDFHFFVKHRKTLPSGGALLLAAPVLWFALEIRDYFSLGNF